MKTIRTINVCLIVALAGIALDVQGADSMSLRVNAAGTVVAYAQISGDAVSSAYTMKVNGASITVNYDGADYTRFAMSGPVTVEITASSPVSSAKVFPTAFGIATAISSNKITFTLDQPRYFRLDVEGKKPLYFFADPLEVSPPKLGDANVKNIMDWPVDNTGATVETPNIQTAIDWVEANHATKNVLYFPNGKYKVGQLHMKSNVTIYLADGALLKCTGNQADYPTVGLPSTMKKFRSQISGKNVGNFKIIGRGIIDGGRNSAYQPHDLLIMAFQNCTKFTVEGLMLRQSDFWHVTSMYGNDKIFRNLKLFTPGIKKLNADGINPISCHNVLIDNCFHIGDDDSFSIGVDEPYPDGVHDITIQNCVACPTRQNSFRISCVMGGPCNNILFKDCYSIGGEGAISAGVYPWGVTFGEVYNIKWENVHSDIPNFISFEMITNSGNRHDFDIINCTTSGSRGGIIKGRNSSSKYYNIRFHNLKVNGKYCHNLTDANISTNSYVHDISFTVGAPPTPISVNSATRYRRLPVQKYRDKMKAGWIGQIAGVSWGAPTEFKWRDKIIPETGMPMWQPRWINHAFGQDDLYVEMTFLRTMEHYGLDCTIRQAGIDFANSGYALWCANDAGRKNLRKGIAPPDSSHPKFNKCPNDIDYQIEADFSGLIAPGMPNVAVALGEKFGRLMNYGDGMYAGQFIGAMYAEAFFEKDIIKIIEAGLKAIPAESQYAEMVRDLLKWSKEVPTWEECWQRCQEKYRKNPEYQRASNGGIDCKINGAYVLLGLLYGKGDLDQTIIISCRGGQDSDCNPSSSAGVLFTALGFSKLPDRFTKDLDEKPLFSHTAYNIPGLLDVCEKLARQAIVKDGGKIEKDANGEEVFIIPVNPVKPSKLELSWVPGPIAESRFTEAERAQITATAIPDSLKKAVERFAPGWMIAYCGPDRGPGLYAEKYGRQNVLTTHPLDRDTACVLSRKVAIPSGKKTSLALTVGHHPDGDWDLIVRANMRELLRKTVGKATSTNGWLDVTVDLSEYAGQSIDIELCNQPTGWAYFEAGHWAKITMETTP